VNWSQAGRVSPKLTRDDFENFETSVDTFLLMINYWQRLVPPRASPCILLSRQRAVFSVSHPHAFGNVRGGTINQNIEDAVTETGALDTAEQEGDNSEEGFKHWLADKGAQFKEARRPRNWLGKVIEDGKTIPIVEFIFLFSFYVREYLTYGSTQPFPLNTTFRPPTPISDALRSELYRLYISDPRANSVRQLAQRYHISLKRVDAILRLKGLESHWKKVRTRFYLSVVLTTAHHDESK
jgi:hypothetical protein